MNRRVLLLGLLGAVVVVVLWYAMLWSPQSKDIDKAKQRQEQAALQNRRLRLQKAQLEDTGSNRPELESRLTTLEVAIPDTPDLAEFILSADDAAAQSGIDLLSITPSPPIEPEGGGTPEMPVQLDLTGGYSQVIDFLNRLYTLPRIMVIDQLTVTADPSATGAPDLSATVTGRLFLTTVTPVAAGSDTTGSTTTTTTANSTTPTPPTSTISSTSSTSTTEAP